MVSTGDGSRPPKLPAAPADEGSSATATLESAANFMAALARRFAEQVQRSLDFGLDGTPTSLAVVDHYLSGLRSEERPEIIELVAAGAGAYFGELIRDEVGGFWIGDGSQPRRARLLLEPHFVFFSPVDLTYRAILGAALPSDDPRASMLTGLDDNFHLSQAEPEGLPEDAKGAARQCDAEWISDRLSELSPVEEDHYFSLTGRFETLQLILEMLATRRVSENARPKRHGLEAYLKVLAAESGGLH